MAWFLGRGWSSGVGACLAFLWHATCIQGLHSHSPEEHQLLCSTLFQLDGSAHAESHTHHGRAYLSVQLCKERMLSMTGFMSKVSLWEQQGSSANTVTSCRVHSSAGA